MSRARNAYRRADFWATGLRLSASGSATPAAGPEPDHEDLSAAAVGQLRYGYTLADLHALARLAVHTAGMAASDWYDRYDTAWSAIVEQLYAAEQPPARHDLVRAGQLAIYAVIDDHRQQYGYYKRKTIGGAAGPGSSPAFITYWELHRHTPSCEQRVVERLSLWAILPQLTDRQREAITALAAHDDYHVAAAALGMTYATFKSHVARGRQRFLALWHEGEPPSAVWGCDRRAGAVAGTARQGSTAASAIRRRARAARARAA